MAGDLYGATWEVDTIVLDDRVVITFEGHGTVISFPDQLATTVMNSLKGMRLSEIVAHAALDPLDIVVTSARRRGAMTVLWICIAGSSLPVRPEQRPPMPGPLPLTTQAFRDLANHVAERSRTM